MLKRNILPKKTKIISIVMLIIFITYICASRFLQIKSYAAQTTESYSSSKISKYPGYKELIENLKSKYPNWNFKILYTGLDWNQVIKNETTAVHERNLVPADKKGAWICNTCGDKTYDSGNWKCASEVAVSYYMDSRNWLNEENIFQFEDLKYNNNADYSLDGINKIIANAAWMNKGNITYTNTSGNICTLEKTYAQIILEAGKESGINPYHLAARILQEQGARSTASSTGKGTYSGYVGYYNFFNINASGSGAGTIITKALTTAKNNGWDNPEKAIKGGSKFLKDQYINLGQGTLYLQKFDVDRSDGSIYAHQYMQNLQAAYSESMSMKKGHTNYNTPITFIIPVYENMPENRCETPDSSSIVTQSVKVTGTNVQVRNSPSLLATVLTKVNTGDVVLRIEYASNQVSGYYWDKVVLSSGVKGYIARNFIEQIPDVTNCNILAVANTSVNLRNGPGTSGTTIITTLIKGQLVTIIEKDTYNNLNGYNWVKVKLANGTLGYIADKYLTNNYMTATINCNVNSSVHIRAEATTSSNPVISLAKGTTVTVMQENVANANGYTWDKIVTSDGLEGFVANKYLNKGENISNNTNQPGDNNKKTLGDVNGNNRLDPSDYVLIKNHIMGVKSLNADQQVVADYNQNGVIDPSDYVLIKNEIMK
ncbi:MAG: SH3 domain-containing protein [Clostridia bacterium]|nr:SH3 domain-containing protein [Clostridia bacterium]